MTRPRKTRAQVILDMEAKLEKYKAQEAGTFRDENENDILKALTKRLRKTNTALKAANITVNGTDIRSSIAAKIEGTQKRLQSQMETQERATEQMAKLPFDIERLEALIEAAEAGEEVEFPTDLTRLGDEQERTDEEHEAAFVASEEEASEES
jgi:hypothetical protein